MGEVEARCHQYICGLIEKIGTKTVVIGGMPDHVHVLAITLPPLSSSELAKRIKGASSRWIKQAFPDCLGVRVAGRIRVVSR